MMRAMTLVLCLMACNGETTETDVDPDTYAGQDVAWADKNDEEKAAYMFAVVVPEMEPLFQAFDAEAYADFGCATCHEDPQNGAFAMPNPNLEPLDINNFPTPDSEDPDIAAFATFMGTQVVPEVADLLEMEPFDPATGQGFGCFGCHTAPM